MSRKGETLVEFKQHIEQGLPITYNHLSQNYPVLYNKIQRYCGGIFKAATELGFTEDELVESFGLTRNINKRTLTESEIKTRLLYLKSIGKLTTNAMRNEFNDLRLEQSIKKTYGSVEEGLDYFNLTRDRVRHSKKSIEKDIKEMAKTTSDMSYTNIISLNSKLVHNATNIYKKSWYDVLDYLEIPYEAKRKKFTRNSVQTRLDAVKDKAGIINYKTIQKHDGSILYYVYDNYESIIDFYIDFGIDVNESADFSKQTIKGFTFEKTFKKMLDILDIKNKFNKYAVNNTIRPDFQLEKGMWIDCKLSAWTSSIEETIEKYTPHCEKLIIVFLRGEYKHLPKINHPKVEFRKIDYYYPFLESIERQDIIEEFHQIITNDKFSESVTTERLTS